LTAEKVLSQNMDAKVHSALLDSMAEEI